MKKRHFHSPDTFVDVFDSPFGRLSLVFSGKTLTAVLFGDPRYPLPIRSSEQSAHFKKQLSDYFQGTLREFDQEISFSGGTEFEKEVWLCLREIPFGETRTYKWVAERIGRPKAVRAVGQALGKNPMPVVLPCHRVIESDGSLGGYSSGTDIKRRLLDLEYYTIQASSN